MSILGSLKEEKAATNLFFLEFGDFFSERFLERLVDGRLLRPLLLQRPEPPLPGIKLHL